MANHIGHAHLLDSAFRSGLALPADFDVRSLESATAKQWDSVAHFQLVVAIEKAFQVQLTPGDVIDLKSYADAVSILKRHGSWPDE